MNTDEKIGQLLLIGLEGRTLDAPVRELIANRHIGGIILFKRNVGSLEQTIGLLNALKAANGSNAAPLFLSVDQEGGAVSRLPAAFAALPDNRHIGQANNPQLAKRIGELLGEELRLLGMNMNYAPVLDVDSNPDNPVIGPRSYGASAALVADLGTQAMKGMQGAGVVPVVKHFPGHGDTEVDSHLELPVVSKPLEELRKLELLPFRRAVQEGADAVMVAHLLIPALDNAAPASFSEPVIDGLLRQELGFQGVVMTDDLTMGAITKHFDIGEAAVRTILAGGDLVMVAHGADRALHVLDALKQAAADGTLTEERLNTSVSRILALKKRNTASRTKPSRRPTPARSMRLSASCSKRTTSDPGLPEPEEPRTRMGARRSAGVWSPGRESKHGNRLFFRYDLRRILIHAGVAFA